MPNIFQKNTKGPSYTSLDITRVANKSLKRETAAFGDTESSSETIRGANKKTVSKNDRNTGRVR